MNVSVFREYLSMFNLLNETQFCYCEQKPSEEELINVQHPSHAWNENIIENYVREEPKMVVANKDTVAIATTTAAIDQRPEIHKKQK